MNGLGVLFLESPIPKFEPSSAKKSKSANRLRPSKKVNTYKKVNTHFISLENSLLFLTKSNWGKIGEKFLNILEISGY